MDVRFGPAPREELQLIRSFRWTRRLLPREKGFNSGLYSQTFRDASFGREHDGGSDGGAILSWQNRLQHGHRP